MNLNLLFPTPIGYFNNSKFTNKILPIAKPIIEKTEEHSWGYVSTYGDKQIHDHLESFTWISSYIKELSYQFVKDIGFYFKHDIKIGSLFISKIENHQHHSRHTHPNALLSGVMYLETTSICAPIVFEDPRTVREFNNLGNTSITKINTPEITFNPKSGDILIFEGWVPHRVPSIKEKGNRLTLVFNIAYDTK